MVSTVNCLYYIKTYWRQQQPREKLIITTMGKRYRKATVPQKNLRQVALLRKLL